MNFKTERAKQYYVCLVSYFDKNILLYIPVCLYIERISPESRKKNQLVGTRARRARVKGRLTFHRTSFSTFEFSL